MTNWYIKEFGRLTGVSVRTLHHYDQIGLLKPSVRQENGYRLYSQADLLKQQQIIALKSFGFKLSQIGELLSENIGLVNNLKAQARFLEEKANMLLDASKILKAVITGCSNDKSIDLKTIVKLIGVYRMEKQLEKTWMGKVLNSDELKEYACFEESLKTRFTQKEKDNFHAAWANLVTDISKNLEADPKSAVGIEIAKRCNARINKLYGKEFAGLKHIVWGKGFMGGHAGEGHGLTKDMITWLDAAMEHYWRMRLGSILERIEIDPDSIILPLWNAALDEMYGDAQNLKNELIKAIVKDKNVNDAIKQWLKKY